MVSLITLTSPTTNKSEFIARQSANLTGESILVTSEIYEPSGTIRNRAVFNKSFLTTLEISLAIIELEKSVVIKLGKAIGIGSTTPSVTSISNSGTFSWEKTKLH